MKQGDKEFIDQKILSYRRGQEDERARIIEVIERYRATEGDCKLCYECVSDILERITNENAG